MSFNPEPISNGTTIAKPSPFIAFTQRVIPATFDESLSYQEALYALLDYLKNQVVNAINQNAEITDKQTKIIEELTDYVNNYFDNLDVQEEINNKLDAMVEDGTLAEVINEEIFGELNNKINTAEENIDNLQTNVSSLQTNVENIEETVEELTNEEIIIMGDSYGASNNSWIDRLITKIGNKATCYKIALGGLGFAHESSIGNYTFLTYLQNQYNNIPDPSKIKKIIVCGGYNDYNESVNDIISAISAFCVYCATNFPNARVYLGMIGYNKAETLDGANIRKNLQENVRPAYSYNHDMSYAPIYIKYSDLILHNKTYIDTDNVHPTNAGMNAIAKQIYEWYIGGSVNIESTDDPIQLYRVDGSTTAGSLHLVQGNEITKIYAFSELNFIFSTPITINSGYLADGLRAVIGTFTTNRLIPAITQSCECIQPAKATIVTGSTTYRNVDVLVGLSYDGKVILYSQNISNNQWVTYSNVTSVRIDTPINLKVLTKFN